ncbi:hypothetical protein [Notoacmeibacter sp. MSK16QG-6]|uniref:hypothetical protein n=1 Tax=Notoacmeibacter sp. MSK16QG-6 TaxID=2957982 RepID=UPI0020A1CD54|nr:hypothetical protein [Notoacmeibacter sp. MSK16QG-6]MCP1199814.1 hypothetical protein [Notoacmeibacter sp. MSK16QG-6]
MFKSIRTAVLSALIALGTVAGVSAPANAGDLRVYAGSGGIYFGFGDHYNRRDVRRNRHYNRGVCRNGRAIRKAARHGLRRAHVVRRNHRVVKVSGRRHGYRTVVTFANARGCPRIR